MSPDLRPPPDPERDPLTDAELATVESEIARLIAAKDAERQIALQERVIATPAETLRGCAAKLRVIFDPDNGPCAGNTIEPHEFAAVAQVVDVIERAIALDEFVTLAMETAVPVKTTPVATLAGAAAVVRCLLDRVVGIDSIMKEPDYQACVKGLTHVLAVIERAIMPPTDNADAALFGVEQQIADLRARARAANGEMGG